MTEIRWYHIALFAFSILYSANPHVSTQDNYLIVGALVSLYFSFQKSQAEGENLLTWGAIFVFIFFIGFEILHGFIYEFYWKTIFRLSLHLIWGLSLVRIFREKFIEYFIKIIYTFLLIGLPIYFLLYIPGTLKLFHPNLTSFFPVLEDITGYSTPTIIFYTFNLNAVNVIPIRFSGFAWEAGALASFVIPALFFQVLRINNSGVRFYHDRVTLVLLISIILTFSTTAYFVLFVIFIGIFLNNKSNVYKLSVIPLLLISFLVYENLPFLKDKVEQQFSTAKTSAHYNRFGAALADLEQISEKPLVGWTRKTKYQFGLDYDEIDVYNVTKVHRPNGVTRFLVSYGVICFVTYFSLIFIGVKKYFTDLELVENSNYYSSLFVIVLLMLGFSQLLFDKVLFKSMLFLFAWI